MPARKRARTQWARSSARFRVSVSSSEFYERTKAAAAGRSRARVTCACREICMTYPVANIDGIGREEGEEVKRVGIRSRPGVLEAAKRLEGRKHLAGKTGIDEKRLLKWANSADRMRIKGVGDDYAELIRAAGVDTVRELKYRNAKRLAEAMAKANEKRKLVQFLPSEKAVQRWIEHAKKLPPKISYK